MSDFGCAGILALWVRCHIFFRVPAPTPGVIRRLVDGVGWFRLSRFERGGLCGLLHPGCLQVAEDFVGYGTCGGGGIGGGKQEPWHGSRWLVWCKLPSALARIDPGLLTKTDPLGKQVWPGLARAKGADDDRRDPALDSPGGKQRL